ADQLAEAGSPLCLGSDSNAVVDLFEEARATELDLRLLTGRRGGLDAEGLLQAASSNGMAALGWEAQELRAGGLADFISLDLSSPRLAGAGEADLLPRVIFGAGAGEVTSVVVGGEEVVRDSRHLRLGSIAERLATALEGIEPAWQAALAQPPQ
ncbi:MAG TPA: amidohydrolase family protein, partial [Candidatus Nanopelagicaceae bacterium]|nr:amidohydrolase family protein [Candidatus Nanopelagicaceae bacterium]